MNPHRNEEQESVKPSTQGPQLCVKGCGFFANPATSDMCSKCFRDTQAQQQVNATASAMATEVAASLQAAQKAQSPEPSPAPPAPVMEAVKAVNIDPSSSASPAAAAASGGADRPVQKNTNRCFECNKRVGYTGFACRCGYIYCGSHRYAEKHNCTYDYKTEGRERLATNNPLVVASKIDKI